MAEDAHRNRSAAERFWVLMLTMPAWVKASNAQTNKSCSVVRQTQNACFACVKSPAFFFIFNLPFPVPWSFMCQANSL
jgi:hypothetical protein